MRAGHPPNMKGKVHPMPESIELLSFSMRTEPPKAKDADWFRIVKAKKGSDITKVYIYDEIGFWGTNAKDFAAALDEIDTKEIHLHVNSPGGSVFDGLAIYNTIKNHDAKVTAIVDGMAASAASFLIQGADNRQISRNAQVMIHDAKAFAGGNAQQMRQAADLLDKISDEIADIYAVNATGDTTAEDFRSLMKAGDHWYNGNEALDAGLVDEVTDNPDEDTPEEATKNVWKAADVEAFLKMSPDKLAASASHVTTTNRVEEALMGDQPATTPPPAATPPAAPAAVPVASVPEAHKFVVNGGEVTDFTAVQQHIAGLEAFRKETIESGRLAFVKQLATDNKISAADETLKATETFALSLSSEQFEQWKASMSAAPSSPLFNKVGVEPGDKQSPANGTVNEAAAEIATLESIVQGHRDSGLSNEQVEAMPSFKNLQTLKSKQTSAS